MGKRSELPDCDPPDELINLFFEPCANVSDNVFITFTAKPMERKMDRNKHTMSFLWHS